MADSLEFVFSFRSPYAWFAARHTLPLLPVGAEVRWRPFFPLPSFENFPPIIPAKTRYLVRDVARLAEAYGLPLQFPMAEDPNWAVPHVAFERAEALGKGPAFALALFDARWTRGENVAEEAVIQKAAESAGLDPEPVLAASRDEQLQSALVAQVESDYEERGIFGVPTLILPRGTRFWGHDRIEWALREGLID